MTLVMKHLTPGTRIRVTEDIARREGPWRSEVTGTVMEVLDAPTGSWYAHGRNDKYHLKRVRLRKDDGEISLVVLDGASVVTVLEPPSAGG